MAGSKTNYWEDAVLNLLRSTSITAPAGVYVALMTSAPGESSAGTEVTGGSYARVSVTFDSPSGGVVTHASDIVFPVPSASWGTVVGIAIMDAASNGNALYYFNFTTSQTINVGNNVKFLAGFLSITEE